MGIRERKEREKGARREEIINAAERVFFARGLTAATMDEIAEAAELSKGTLYLYYKSKEDLYLTVALRGTEFMYALFEDALAAGSNPIRQLYGLGEAYYAYFKKYRNYYRMYYYFENPRIHSQVSTEVMEQCRLTEKKVWDLVVGVIQRAIDEGLFRKDIVPIELGVMLWSNSNGLMRLIDRNEKEWEEERGLDLEGLIRKSNGLLVGGMMTDQAKSRMPELVAGTSHSVLAQQ